MLRKFTARKIPSTDRRSLRKVSFILQDHKPLKSNQTSKEIDHTQEKRILADKIIRNSLNSEKLLEMTLEKIKVAVKFSEKCQLFMNLPSILALFQLKQIMSSYTKLLTKNCPPHLSFAGIQAQSPFEKSKQLQKVCQNLNLKEKIEHFGIQILTYIHQNTLLAENLTEHQRKLHYIGENQEKVHILEDLFQFQTKVRSQNHMEAQKCLQDLFLSIKIRYQTSKIHSRDHFCSLINGEDNFQSNEDIYIKQYTEGSQNSEKSKEKSFSSQELPDFQEKGKNFITFDPKQALDSGRLRVQSKSAQSLIKWFNQGEILDYMVLKEMINGERKGPNNQFHNFPMRFRGSSEEYQLCIWKIQKRVKKTEINNLLIKILEKDTSLDSNIFECYFLQQKNQFQYLIFIGNSAKFGELSLDQVVDFSRPKISESEGHPNDCLLVKAKLFLTKIISENQTKSTNFFRTSLNSAFESFKKIKSKELIELYTLFNSIILSKSFKIHHMLTKPKNLFFSLGDSIDIFEKQTTLKKNPKSSQSTHKNSLELKPEIFHTSEFNSFSIFIFTLVFSREKRKNHGSQKEKVHQEKENKRQSLSAKKNQRPNESIGLKNGKKMKKNQIIKIN